MHYGFGGHPNGIPIPSEVHEQYPENVKTAWETFHQWWTQVNSGDKQPSRGNMPKDVAQAMNTILEAPIPGYDGATGADSCYMVNVLARLGD